jgi:histidyl-tRNA synthetase
MVEKISIPRGTSDILPSEVGHWQHIEEEARRIFNLYNYKEIRTPVFEDVRLFKRSLGQTSDVVNKQLLELKSAQEEGHALRPEGTASVVRSYIENSILV